MTREPRAAGALDKRTVFIKGLPFDLEEKQLEGAFGEIGPVRKSFLLRNKGAAGHKGAGFVQFALAEDASRAISAFSGRQLLGRPVQITEATKRASLAERKQRKRDRDEAGGQATDTAPAARKEPKQRKLAAIQDATKPPRTVALGNLSSSTKQQALEAAAAIGEVEEIISNVAEDDVGRSKLREDGCKGDVVLVVYKTVHEALEAVQRLHCKALKPGRARKEAGPDPTEPVNPLPNLWARQLRGEGALVKKWRVILRNLPFNVKEDELKEALSPAGFVWHLTLPRKDNGSAKGFAFASFLSRADAQRAIELFSGKKIRGRLVALDWAVSKAAFQAALQVSGLGQPDEGLDITEEGQEDVADQMHEDGETSMESDVAEQQDVSEGAILRKLAAEIADGKVDSGLARPGNSARKGSSAHRSAPEGATAQKSLQSQAEASGTRSEPAHSSTGRTVFVRNLLGDVTKQQLAARLQSFGDVQACRLVTNTMTRQCKGTAFVEFREPAAAQAAAAACKEGRAGRGAGVSLSGRSLEIDIALSQTDARALAATKGPSSVPKDARNLYLAREGAIEEGSSAWNDLSKGDKEKRLRASKEKALKLRSPNYFVSATRLSLRNLPYSLDEKALKALLTDAVKEHAAYAVPRLVQVKLLREPSKRDSKGEPLGKGIGFAEFSEHDHALCALRQLNNNPGPFGSQRRPIVEFAVENAQIVKKRETREAGRKGRQPRTKDRIEGPAGRARTGGGEEKIKPPKQTLQKELSGPSKSGSPEGDRKDRQQIRERRRSQNRDNLDETLPSKADKDIALKQEAVRPHGQGKEKGRKRSSAPEKIDAFDSLVAEYKASLFGKEGRKKPLSSKEPTKRWFE